MDENNILTLTDEDGHETDFEIADLIVYDGKEFVILLPVTDEEEVEVTILNVMEDEKGIERFYPVKDEETLSTIFDIFEAKFEGEIEFVD